MELKEAIFHTFFTAILSVIVYIILTWSLQMPEILIAFLVGGIARMLFIIFTRI
jgi:hypothetical protein|tara:strand:- start:9574 stop:9735 length:162 start_codon:yes stop_codon:yes gene_type:complete